MLNLDSTALPYEPYGYKLPILSNSTVTSIYLGEVETTRRIKKLVLTGEEITWSQHSTLSSWFMLNLDNIESEAIVTDVEICTHYVPSQEGAIGIKNGEILVNISFNNKRLIIKDTKYSTINDFKSFLAAQYAAGTPVTVWYVLAEPETGIVNEPLRKIGDYVDTVSYEQAGVSIAALHGNTIIDVETTLKPSQMYIKYK
jgi:hypothetical protein